MPKLSERLFITRVDAKQEIMRERQLNQREREIRTDIAKKLLAFNLKELNVKTIAKVTDLPLKIVEKLYQMAYLK